MRKQLLKKLFILLCLILSSNTAKSQVIISQYYEGTGTNKWIELTNTTNAAINTASPQLKLGIWAVTGSTGNIAFAGAPSSTVNLTVTIPAFGSVLIGNTGNGTEVPYLTAASAAMTSNTVINFNGNDGIALLDVNNVIIDQFGTGINAADVSYVRSTAVTMPAAAYVASQWTSAAIATVQNATTTDPVRLNYQLSNGCAAPANQPNGLVFGSPTTTSIAGSFMAASADEYLLIYSTSASLSANPVNGTVYNAGNTIGNGTVLSRGTATSFSAPGLNASTTYYFYVFALNSLNCTGGPAYKTTTPLTGNAATLAPPCTAPANQPTGFTISNVTASTITGAFTATTANEYLVVYSTAATLTANPVNGIVYNPGNVFGNATVISRGTTTTFAASGLLALTKYYISVFALNSTACTGGPIYKTTIPLTGSATTTEAPLYYYFGNFHSHSQYSDGDGLPSGDFSFADTANCMDFLGISEHNHVGAGMSLGNWSLGRSQAQASTTPTFLAMYGMEWGVISGGGHVVVYGVNKLLGWDAGQYEVYVPQSMYTGSTGLFTTISSFGPNAFATLAHPNNADYNGIMSTYDTVSDDAIVGSAVENGPSTSVDVTYTDPPASMTYLSYYRNMLARGYHLGPTIDHDNHNVTHGHTATSRTVILSPGLTENDILNSMRMMRFYASQDCNAYVTFKINNKPLGTIMTAAGTPTITVAASGTNPITSIKIYSGISGSGSNATVLTSSTSGSISYTHAALANLSSRYYYIDITEADGKRIVTAPIWYTRNDAAKMADDNSGVIEFFAIAEPKKVVLKWMTNKEANNQQFTLEKSYDNHDFETLTTDQGKGFSTFTHNYSFTDENYQNDGVTYYKLTQRDATGKIVYTSTQSVSRKTQPLFTTEVYPNPVADNAILKIENANGEEVQLLLYDISGKLIYEKNMQIGTGDQEMALPVHQLHTGIYFVTLKAGNYTVTKKVIKL